MAGPRYTKRERAMLAEFNEIEQILGKALGYPAYGPEMFEDGNPDGTVCVGDHVPVTLAMEAAQRIAKLNERGRAIMDWEVELAKRFTYHPPTGDQPKRYIDLREATMLLARRIIELTPSSREQALALTNLEQAVMWANAAIARDPPAQGV
jgi:hypothetical protein